MESGTLYLVAKRLSLSVGSTKVFFPVFITPLWKSMSRVGSRVKVQKRLHTTPLARTMPISIPIFSLINTSIRRPTTVVSAELRMEGTALLTATLTAITEVRIGFFSWR